MYWLIYRMRHDRFPELGFTRPVGGLVIPITHADAVQEIAQRQFHCAPWERLWYEDVSDWPPGRKQALRLHQRWWRDMGEWLETCHGQPARDEDHE